MAQQIDLNIKSLSINSSIVSTANEIESNDSIRRNKVKYREREEWNNKFEFIFACMAYAIGYAMHFNNQFYLI
jgi:hypothetical protein